MDEQGQVSEPSGSAPPPAAPASSTPPPEKGSRLWLWILLGIVVVLVIVAIVLTVALKGGKAEVPSLAGLSLTEGVAELEAAQLRLGEVTYTSDVPAGTEQGQIVSQKPAAGEAVDEGTQVDVVVAGKAEVKVPDVVGMTADEAARTLGAAGLQSESVQVENEAEPGTVVDQSPAAGTPVAPGSQVTVMVSTGVTQTLVPKVVGLTEADATATLEEAGYKVEKDTTYDDQVEAGIVVNQSPDAGTAAEPGAAVTITVSKGSNPTVTVPNVVGMTEAEAAKALSDAGYEPVSSGSFDNTVPAGDVISQDPQAGVAASVGSAVNIVISLGPKPAQTATVPDVVGQTEAEAVAALEQAGYQVVTATIYSDDVPKGVVGEQVPPAGSVTQPGITVGIVASAGPRPTVDFVLVPDVRGMTLDQATATLGDLGLKVTSAEFFTELAPKGQVFAQLPPAGYPVPPGATVIVVVSLGPYLQVNPL